MSLFGRGRGRDRLASVQSYCSETLKGPKISLNVPQHCKIHNTIKETLYLQLIMASILAADAVAG